MLLAALLIAAAAQDMTVERDIVYGKGGDVELKLDMYRPAEMPKEPVPAVVLVHGGGWQGGDKAGFGRTYARFLVPAGYVCVSVNYRLTGVAPFPACIEDCKCAVRWLRANAAKYGVNPNRIGCLGASAGGHLVELLGAADGEAGLEGKGGYAGVSSRVQAVVSYFGPSDLTGMPMTQRTKDGPVGRLIAGAEDTAEALKKAGPAAYVTKDDPPVLLIHGDKDMTVPLRQSETYRALLEKAGVGVKLVVVKNAGHGLRPVGGQPAPGPSEVRKEVLAFLDKHLKS